MVKGKGKTKAKTKLKTNTHSRLLALPVEVLLAITTDLSRSDIECLALACKSTRELVHRFKLDTRPWVKGLHSHLMTCITSEQSNFFIRLQKGWVPKDLKWCGHCGKFKTQNKAFWNHISEQRRHAKFGGKLNLVWAALIKTGHFQKMVDKWCGPKARYVNSAVKMCPNCQISKLSVTSPSSYRHWKLSG